MFRGNLLHFSLCLLLSGLALGTIDPSLAHSSLHSSFRYLYILMGSPQASSSWGWKVPVPSATPQRNGTCPFVILVTLCWTFSLLYPNISYTGGCKPGHRTSGTLNYFSAICVGKLKSDVSEKLMHIIYTEIVSSLLRILFQRRTLAIQITSFPSETVNKNSKKILKMFALPDKSFLFFFSFFSLLVNIISFEPLECFSYSSAASRSFHFIYGSCKCCDFHFITTNYLLNFKFHNNVSYI